MLVFFLFRERTYNEKHITSMYLLNFHKCVHLRNPHKPLSRCRTFTTLGNSIVPFSIPPPTPEAPAALLVLCHSFACSRTPIHETTHPMLFRVRPLHSRTEVLPSAVLVLLMRFVLLSSASLHDYATFSYPLYARSLGLSLSHLGLL